jgi:hypothetical protein
MIGLIQMMLRKAGRARGDDEFYSDRGYFAASVARSCSCVGCKTYFREFDECQLRLPNDSSGNPT